MTRALSSSSSSPVAHSRWEQRSPRKHAQKEASNIDPDARSSEGPIHEVTWLPSSSPSMNSHKVNGRA